MPLQFCRVPGCGVLVSSGACPAHAPRERATRLDYALVHRWYGSARWQRLRREVLHEEPFCRHCRNAGRKVLTVDIDHIVKHDGDPVLFWDRQNLQGLCKSCHTVKTSRGE
jgi:5-methylcytosine-specific restriction protein A